jgi:uroporphyrinogen decarboxylase
MTGKQIIDSALEGKILERVPFAPAIYEHKAALIGLTPTEVCSSSDLLEKAILKEYETYRPDLLTVGVDLYTVEAESLGCRIQYFPDTNDVPTIRTHVLSEGAEIDDLRLPDPDKDGRIPLLLEVGRRVAREVGDEVYVRIAVTAPFSMACGLLGSTEFLLLCFKNEDYAKNVLSFCTEVAKHISSAFLKAGLQVIVFDSSAAPPILSPLMYERFVLPFVQDLFNHLKKNCRARLMPYIVGGDTTGILGSLMEAGANNILADYVADLDAFIGAAKLNGVLLRGNIDPALIGSGTPEEIKNVAQRLLQKGRSHAGFLMGTGVVPYGSPVENVQAVREALHASSGIL